MLAMCANGKWEGSEGRGEEDGRGTKGGGGGGGGVGAERNGAERAEQKERTRSVGVSSYLFDPSSYDSNDVGVL